MIIKKVFQLVSLILITFFSQAQCLSGDCQNGKGSAVIDSSITYTGTFKNGIPDGQGIFSNAFGRIYEGGVWKGLYHGKGKLVYDNGDFYVGDFKQGLRHGKGIFSSTTGIVMNGSYVHDRYMDTTKYANVWMGHDHFTNYSLNSLVFSSDNTKVAVVGQSSLSVNQYVKIFDITTGKFLESVSLKHIGCEAFKTAVQLYLDFGKEYETHMYDGEYANTIQLLCPAMEKLYAKKSVKLFYYWQYAGKTPTGEALFWVRKSSLKNSNIESSLIAYRDSKATPRTIIKPSPEVSEQTVVSPDLKMVPKEIKWGVLTQNSSLKNTDGVLVYLLSDTDPDYLLPLIDPHENVATIKSMSSYLSDMSKAQEERRLEVIAKYKRQMEAQYGADWEQQFADNPLQKKIIPPSSNSSGTSNHTCQVCFGSGKVVDPLQDNLVQDKNSGRWYKKMGTVYTNCLRCGGKGYVTY